ncbi:hypothetical protein KGO95_00430 [Patescibacteria group bacterium]|nr:hypothetical protein [Patescibacteria group bacterium]
MAQFKNTGKAIRRILLAKQQNEKIGIWGDYDPDGIPGATLIRSALLGAGFKRGDLTVILPNIKRYNRSFNPVHLRLLKRKGVSLILGVDFGTADFAQVKMAHDMGFDIILFDHHLQLPGKLPAILINHLQKGDHYPHKNWSGTGVAYKFFEAFYHDQKLDLVKLEKNIDLLTLALIADRIPIDGYNDKYIERGVHLLNRHTRPGLQAFLHLTENDHITRHQVMSTFISRFYPRRSNEENELYRLFTAKTQKAASRYAKILNGRYRAVRAEIDSSVQKGVDAYKAGARNVVVLRVNMPSLASGMVAAVSEGLVEKIEIPVFVYKRQKNFFQGSARAPLGSDFNLSKALDTCKDIMISYGGHPTAIGFHFKASKEKQFQKAVQEYFNNLSR